MPKQSQSIEEKTFIRDACSVYPKPKSEMKRRFDEILAQHEQAVRAEERDRIFNEIGMLNGIYERNTQFIPKHEVMNVIGLEKVDKHGNLEQPETKQPTNQ